MELLKHIELGATQYLENQSYNLPQSSPNAATGTSNPLYSAPFFHTAFQPYSNSLNALTSPLPPVSSPTPDIFHPNHPTSHLLSTFYVPYSSTSNSNESNVVAQNFNNNNNSSPIACISLSPITPSQHLLPTSNTHITSNPQSISTASQSQLSANSSLGSKRFQSRKIDVVRPTSIRIPPQPLTTMPLHSHDINSNSQPARSPLTPWSPFTPMSPLTPLSPSAIFHHLPIKAKREETVLLSNIPPSSMAVPVSSQSNLQTISGSIMPQLSPVPLSSTSSRSNNNNQVSSNPLALLSFYSAQSPLAPPVSSPTPSTSQLSASTGSTDESGSSLASTEQHVCSFPNCNKAFHKPSALKRHIRTHTGERPYVCSINGCGLSFAERGNLKRHERVHSGEKPHKCEHCGHLFARRCHLLQHYRAKHPAESRD